MNPYNLIGTSFASFSTSSTANESDIQFPRSLYPGLEGFDLDVMTNDASDDLESFLFGSFYKKVLFKVSGNSMKDAGIFDGDFAIVDKGRNAQVGDIVIAHVNGKYSIKYLQKDEMGKLFLMPANKKFSPVYPEGELQVFGVVSSIVRNVKKY